MKNRWIHAFLKAFARIETTIASSKIWIYVDDSVFKDDNCYASLLYINGHLISCTTKAKFLSTHKSRFKKPTIKMFGNIKKNKNGWLYNFVCKKLIW